MDSYAPTSLAREGLPRNQPGKPRNRQEWGSPGGPRIDTLEGGRLASCGLRGQTRLSALEQEEVVRPTKGRSRQFLPLERRVLRGPAPQMPRLLNGLRASPARILFFASDARSLRFVDGFKTWLLLHVEATSASLWRGVLVCRNRGKTQRA